MSFCYELRLSALESPYMTFLYFTMHFDLGFYGDV